MKDLNQIFGHCIIPKNTYLYRGHSNSAIEDCMFFATKHWVASAFNDSIQIWKTTTDISVLFLVDYVTKNSWYISSLPKLYSIIFKDEVNHNFTDLDIKHWDLEIRNKLVHKLYSEFQISGWLSSLENRVEMEICLFNKQANSIQLILDSTSEKGNKEYYKDSLQKIKIYTPNSFIEKTSINLNEFTSREKAYNNHKKHITSLIDFYVTEDYKMNKNEARHYLYDLRTKLKI
jgi:hypothetical protein